MMPVTGVPIKPRDEKETDTLNTVFEVYKSVKEIGSTAGTFVSS
jgi:hypothetical protein